MKRFLLVALTTLSMNAMTSQAFAETPYSLGVDVVGHRDLSHPSDASTIYFDFSGTGLMSGSNAHDKAFTNSANYGYLDTQILEEGSVQVKVSNENGQQISKNVVVIPGSVITCLKQYYEKGVFGISLAYNPNDQTVSAYPFGHAPCPIPKQ